MAETDQDQKTEEPTSKRLEEARKEGQIPISREIVTWALFVAVLIVVAWMSGGMADSLGTSLRVFIEKPHEIDLEGRGFQAAFADVLGKTALATVMVFALLGFASILGTMVQTGFYMNAARMKPDITRLSPIQGFKKLFSMNSLAELIKSFVKIIVLGFVAYLLIKPLYKMMPQVTGHDMQGSLAFLHGEAVHMIVVMMIIITFIAVADLVFVRYQYFKGLRMTKQEVKDEYKQMEGDPFIKSRLRQIRMEKARKRMMAQVPKADVVITNPTHYAVALQYDRLKAVAPVVLAKGADRVAERIREVAGEHEIPLVSNPPLARALYDTVNIDEVIHPEHYRAVAEVISYVYKLKKKKF